MIWNSSPLRGNSATEELAKAQKDRVNALYHPMSSPTSGRQRLRLQREGLHEKESEQERKKRLEQHALALQVDIDVLIAEEEEQRLREQANINEEGDEDRYEEELEDYLMEADLELEAQLRAMNIT
ncbi:hypothetical protein CA7LBN_002279 [Candidozyma auris]|uniref:Uncharacterized protein n=1 Tax=Candidozyma auris TaxID=498019 RepID=A0A8F2W0J5_CANAR|nr:hypothetical protein CA7LBN_002279 [[Candida] auris]